jgi:hypothetical protein
LGAGNELVDSFSSGLTNSDVSFNPLFNAFCIKNPIPSTGRHMTGLSVTPEGVGETATANIAGPNCEGGVEIRVAGGATAVYVALFG